MHRIRVSLLLCNENHLLFVREKAEPRVANLDIDPDQRGFWQLPGGGLEPGESVYEGAVREAQEETSLIVRAERIVYVQEYVNPIEPFYQIEFIILASVLGGDPKVSPLNPVIELRYLSEKDRGKTNVAPWHDRAVIWDDLQIGFPSFRHLGVDVIRDGKRVWVSG